MASLNEQMDNLLTPDSFKEGLTKSAEENKDESMSDIFSFDRIKKEVLPQFREKDEIIEKATATGTGLLTGTLGLPSDIISMASAGADLVGDYTNNPTFTVVKDLLNRAEEEAGRPVFDKWFTETTGLESNPTNTDQLIGEILSPTGAFLLPFKTLNKLFKPLKKGASEFFDNLPDGTGGAKLATEGPSASNINKTSPIDDFNQPTINLSEIGIKTPDGLAASKTYEKLEADAMGGSYNEERYTELTLAEKDKLFRETGVYRGSEGKLRYKISTAEAQLDQGYLKELGVLVGGGNTGIIPTFNTSKIPSGGLTLKEILNFKDLYRNYRSVESNGVYGLLENIKVKSFDSYIEKMGLGKEAMTDLKNTQAIYSRTEGVETIYIRTGKNIKATKDDLLHEIQHAIQHREGFIAGSSPESFLNGKTQFGKDYQANINSTFYEKKDAFTQLEKRVGDDGKRIFAPFLDDKDLFESVTDKLVKREYENILQGVANKPSRSQYYGDRVSIKFPIPGVGVRYLDTRDLLVDPPSFVRNEMKPMEYKGYDGDKITFNEKEADLANALSNKVGFQDYVRQRIILENNVRNQKLMEAEAHEMYSDVIGEVQARKIVEDNDLYRIAKDKMGYKPNETVPKEVQEEIFRQIRPSKTGLLEGQTIKPQGSNVNIST